MAPRTRAYLVLALVLGSLVPLPACGWDDDERSVTSIRQNSVRELAMVLQSMAAPVARDRLPLREEAAEAELVGIGTLVSVRPGPVFIGAEQFPGFEPALPFLALEIEVDRLAKGGDLVAPGQPLVVLRPVTVSTDTEAFRNLDPTPVAFFLDPVSLAELAGEFASAVPDTAPGVGEDSVLAEPSNLAAFFARDGDVGFPLLTTVQRPDTPADLTYLVSLGFPVNALDSSESGS